MCVAGDATLRHRDTVVCKAHPLVVVVTPAGGRHRTSRPWEGIATVLLLQPPVREQRQGGPLVPFGIVFAQSTTTSGR